MGMGYGDRFGRVHGMGASAGAPFPEVESSEHEVV